MSRHKIPCTIRGVTYPSLSEAARSLNLHLTTLHVAHKEGRLETVGLQPLKTVALIYRLSQATPEELDELKEQASRWLRRHEQRTSK